MILYIFSLPFLLKAGLIDLKRAKITQLDLILVILSLCVDILIFNVLFDINYYYYLSTAVILIFIKIILKYMKVPIADMALINVASIHNPLFFISLIIHAVFKEIIKIINKIYNTNYIPGAFYMSGFITAICINILSLVIMW